MTNQDVSGYQPLPSDAISGQRFHVDPDWRRLIDVMSQALAIGEVIRDETGAVVNFRFLLQNITADRLLGLSAADVVGKLGDQLSKTEFGLWVEIFDRAVSDRRVKTYVYKFPTDQRRWRVSVMPFASDRFAILYDAVHPLDGSSDRH